MDLDVPAAAPAKSVPASASATFAQVRRYFFLREST
jgi:hypothetical protein